MKINKISYLRRPSGTGWGRKGWDDGAGDKNSYLADT